MAFKCELCNNVFSRKYSLNRHMDRCIVKVNPELLLECIKKMDNNHKLETIESKEKIDELTDKVKELKDKVKELTIEHKSKKPSTIDNTDDNIEISTLESLEIIKNNHYVYIIKEREFIKTNESIYKIGRTEKGHYKRTSQYPKGSVMMTIVKVSDSKIYETKIKEVFNKKFKQRKDIGSEYYEANFKSLFKQFIKVINKLNEDR